MCIGIIHVVLNMYMWFHRSREDIGSAICCYAVPFDQMSWNIQSRHNVYWRCRDNDWFPYAKAA